MYSPKNGLMCNMASGLIILALLGCALPYISNAEAGIFYKAHSTPALLDEYPGAYSNVDSLDCEHGVANISIYSKTESPYKYDTYDYFLKEFDSFLSENSTECPVSRTYIRQYLNGNIVSDYYLRDEAPNMWRSDRFGGKVSVINKVNSERDVLDYFYMRKSSSAAFARYADKKIEKYFLENYKRSKEELLFLYDTFGDLDLSKINFGDRIQSTNENHLRDILCESEAIIHCLPSDWSVNYFLRDSKGQGGMPPLYTIKLVAAISNIQTQNTFKGRILMERIRKDSIASAYFDSIASGSYKDDKISPPNNFRVTEAIQRYYADRCPFNFPTRAFAEDNGKICELGISGINTSLHFALVDDLRCREISSNVYNCTFRTRAMMQASAPRTNSILMNDLMNSITSKHSPWRYIEGVLTPTNGGWLFEPVN